MRYRSKRYLLPIIILTMAFAAPGTLADKARPTTHAEMMVRLASLDASDLADGHVRLRTTCIGTSVKGKEIPLVRVCDPNVPQETTRRLFVICRQHGDEPATTEAMLNLIERLVLSREEDVTGMLSRVSFYIVPMMNPDGADAFARRNANGADLNRDWLSLKQPETKCVRAAIDAVSPDVLIDAHELSPKNRKSDFIETAGPACGASPEMAAESKLIQALVVGVLRTHDMNVKSYEIDDAHPARLAHRYFPIHGNTKTLLFETRQAGQRQYQLKYRMNLHTIAL